jgi:uncharacterized membrane protein YjjP (DUF1212 family)
VIARLLPKDINPQLFGFLAALTLVGGLAYVGSTGAGVALVLLLIGGVLLLVSGILF